MFFEGTRCRSTLVSLPSLMRQIQTMTLVCTKSARMIRSAKSDSLSIGRPRSADHNIPSLFPNEPACPLFYTPTDLHCVFWRSPDMWAQLPQYISSRNASCNCGDRTSNTPSSSCTASSSSLFYIHTLNTFTTSNGISKNDK